MMLRLFAGLLLMGVCTVHAALPDSIRITRILTETSSCPLDENKILYLAKGFQGTPYGGGTLEAFPFEQLVVRTDSVDCTTFVEYVLALKFTADQISDRIVREDSLYHLFKEVLTSIRYRGGRIDGYTSRLHYFSEWISDNQHKGYVREVTKDSPCEIRTVSLNFMTEHASLYPQLAHDSLAVVQMKALESRWLNYQMPYIPKSRLGEGSNVLHIKDGDILTLVTNIRGLDVVHVGFACWMSGKLHLLHASSAKKRVLLDPVSLYDYTKNKKAHIGIRVVRVCH